MKNSPLSWLDYSEKSLAAAVQDWHDHKNSRTLQAWLCAAISEVGDIEQVTPDKMQTFVQGVCAMDYETAAAYELPLKWPLESIAKTQILRDIMLQVPAWLNNVREDMDRANKLGIKQLLYSTDEHKAILASNNYAPETEALRMHLGMPANTDWWRKLPLWSQEDKNSQQKNNGWLFLMRQVLANAHPEQGTRLALLAFPLITLRSERREDDDNEAVFTAPTVEQVLASNIQGKMALALWQAINCPRDAIPNPNWWTHWDQWCREEQQPAELALATLLLAKIAGVESSQSERILRNTLVRLASLRDPPENFSLLTMQIERRKYASWSMDALIGRVVPVENRTLRFFEGLTESREQLLLHYQALQHDVQPALSFPATLFENVLVS